MNDFASKIFSYVATYGQLRRRVALTDYASKVGASSNYKKIFEGQQHFQFSVFRSEYVSCLQKFFIFDLTLVSNYSRSDRIARYKEERRRELAAQFGPRSGNASSLSSSKIRLAKDSNSGGTSSGSEGPRATRASRLRLAALSQDNVSSSQGTSRYASEVRRFVFSNSSSDSHSGSICPYTILHAANVRILFFIY